MAGEVERRRAERRDGQERRASVRTDALARRAQLRRQADLLAFLGSSSQEEQDLAREVPCLDARVIRFHVPAALAGSDG
jgi:hypothetical protein